MTTTAPVLADAWTVRDTLKPGTLHRLTGDTDAISTVAFDLAAHVAAGISWHGQGVQQGRVLYVSDQVPQPPAARTPDTGVARREVTSTSRKGPGPSVLNLRLKAWKAHHGVADALAVDFSQPVHAGGPYWWRFTSTVAKRGYALIVVDDPGFTGISPNLHAKTGSDPDATVAEFQAIADATGAAVVLTQHPSVPVTGGRVLAVSESGSTVSVRVADRTGAAPLRFNLTPVPVDVDGDRYTPHVLTSAHDR